MQDRGKDRLGFFSTTTLHFFVILESNLVFGKQQWPQCKSVYLWDLFYPRKHKVYFWASVPEKPIVYWEACVDTVLSECLWMNHPLGSPVMQWPVKLLDPWQFWLCQNTESTLTIFITELDPWNHHGGWKKHLVDSWEVHAAIWVVCIGGHHLWCASYLLGLQLNPASGCLAPGVFCLEYATKPKKKMWGRERTHCFNFQQLGFHSCWKLLIKLSAAEFIAKKKKKSKMVKWRNTSYLSLLSCSPPPLSLSLSFSLPISCILTAPVFCMFISCPYLT